MAADGRRHIVTLGGGFRPNGAGGWRVSPLLRYVLDLSGRPDPEVGVLNTALGDDATTNLRFVEGLGAAAARASHLALFPMPNVGDVRAWLLAKDVIVVGGGSVANLVAVWRVHGLDAVFREAWERGVILSGASAGALCWFAGGTTDSFGKALQPFTAGLALLPHSYSPHYDSEEQRRPQFQRLVGDGTIPPGWAADDGVALHFIDTELAGAVSDRDAAAAWRVEPGPDGPVETRVEPRRLPEPEASG